MRSLHYWLATVFVVTLVLHMIRTFATGAFKAPRELILLMAAAGLSVSKPGGMTRYGRRNQRRQRLAEQRRPDAATSAGP